MYLYGTGNLFVYGFRRFRGKARPLRRKSVFAVASIHVDCMMSGFRSMRFEHESIACLSLDFLLKIRFRVSLLKIVMTWMSCKQCIDNSVKFRQFSDFETLLRKSCSLHSKTKSQVICDGKNFSLGRTASFLVKISLIAEHLGQLNFTAEKVVVSG